MAYVHTSLGWWHYADVGTPRRSEDPIIVLLHGLFFDGGMWDAQLEALSGLGRVLVFDGPGHGKSAAPRPFSLEDHADALVDVLDGLAVDRAIVVGASWGAMTAVRMAIRHPTRAFAMALLGADAAAPPLKQRANDALLVALLRTVGVPRRVIERMIVPRMFGERSVSERPELVASFVRRVRGPARTGLATAASAVLHRTDILDRLHMVRSPNIVICGREDRAAPWRLSEAIAERTGAAKMVWIEGAGHSAPVERPDAVTDTLVEFVTEQLARA